MVNIIFKVKIYVGKGLVNILIIYILVIGENYYENIFNCIWNWVDLKKQNGTFVGREFCGKEMERIHMEWIKFG